MEIATLALGCFWAPDAYFTKLDGVQEVTVGYSGGTKAEPTYHDLGDHSEALQITFDPKLISYDQLLEHFWQLHDPWRKQNAQYRSVIFYHDDAQRKAAEVSLAQKQSQTRDKILTTIEPAGGFTRAEDYHQKYYAKHGF